MRVMSLHGHVCAVAVATVAMWAMMAPLARAGEASPYGVDFSLHTTRTVEVPLGGGQTEFRNEPYAFTQAGGHPEALTATFAIANEEIKTGAEPVVVPARDPKDIVVSLPPGLLGNPAALERCPLDVALGGTVPCPASTQVGVYRFHWNGTQELLGPIFNVVPEAGQSAEFVLANEAKVNPVLTAHVVRTPAGYGLTVVSNEIPAVELTEVETTFWGMPAAASNDPMRGIECSSNSQVEPLFRHCRNGGKPGGGQPTPFLTWPTDCTAGASTATMRSDSWQEPGSVREQHYEGYVEEAATLPGVTGCNALQFDPGIAVEPDSVLADAPVGLGVDLKVPQVEEAERLATPELRSAVVTLPLGMSVNPGIVDGVQACEESGPHGINFTGPLSEEKGLNGELQLAAGDCPDASIVGEAEAVTPLLREPVKGYVFLAKPGCGGAGQSACTEQDALDGNLYKLYLELGGTGPLANTGVHLKVPGEVQANPATGQLTTRFEGFMVGDPPHFEGNPQLPFSELKVRLAGGERAAIANPPACGPATTTADLSPWSAPGLTPELPGTPSVFMAGTPDATPATHFLVEGCATPPGLNPGFVAGTVTPNAAKFSAFTLNISRKDREQYVKGIQIHTPPGLLGMLSSVPLCGEPEADTGTCPEASKIGTTRVATGAGSHPFDIEGSVYLTGPHDGDPFGLSVVTHAVAGPFNLGLVVVRARIAVDPQDSTLTITTDETGPYAVPQIIFGVPLRLQRITVDIDRPNFMFNPTNCGAHQITAAISGNQQAVAEVSSPFAVGNCGSLLFKPAFAVSTSGHTSRADGASLDVKLSYPKGAFGNDANIARVKVSLPQALPSRLETLRRSCLAATFAASPTSCPSASVVGIARASTPLLPVELSGPVYFVSHGNEAFPSLIVVLQGDGVRVDLTGATFINKKGVTTSTFNMVPDVPVNTFELYFPKGRYSALGAYGDLCKIQSKLKMPTEFTAQNGAVFRQNTQISVTGCKAGSGINRHRDRASTTHKPGRTG